MCHFYFILGLYSIGLPCTYSFSTLFYDGEKEVKYFVLHKILWRTFLISIILWIIRVPIVPIVVFRQDVSRGTY